MVAIVGTPTVKIENPIEVVAITGIVEVASMPDMEFPDSMAVTGNVGIVGVPTVNVNNPVTSVGIEGTVPVSGNVGITGIPTVHVDNPVNTVSISGTVPVSGNVGISGIPIVHVENPVSTVAISGIVPVTINGEPVVSVAGTVPVSGNVGVSGSVSVTNTPNVNVANTSVPITGSVSVTNSPNVSVTNTPNVNVTNTPNVNVTNSSIPVSGTVTANITAIGNQADTTATSDSGTFSLIALIKRLLGKFSPNAYPAGATPVAVQSTSAANTANSASLPATAGKTTYVSGIYVSAGPGLLSGTVAASIVGILGGTTNFVVYPSNGAQLRFDPAVPAAAVNSAITVNVGTSGLGLISYIYMTGYQL